MLLQWLLPILHYLILYATASPSSETCLLSRSAPQFNFCPATSWPPAEGGLVTSQLPDAELQEILKEIDPERIKSYIHKLVSFGTRHTLSTQTDPNRGIGAARDWIAAKMREFATASGGRMTVTVPSYTQQPDGDRVAFPVRISDIVATLKGDEDPSRIYVISGHYDTRVTDPNNFQSDAPGADDDGSGTAISMELARVMASRRPRATLVFSVVAGEEQNLYGSNFLAQTYKNASVNVAGMLNNDIVGSSTGDEGTKDPFTVRVFAQGPPLTESPTVAEERLTVGSENDSPARELARFIVEVAQNTYTGMKNIAVIYRLDRYLRGGDHSSYLKAGFNYAVRFTEPRENFKHQHQDVQVENGVQFGDLPEFVDYDYVARVARVNAAAFWSMAQAPPVPGNVSINTTALSNNSTFMWLPANDTGLAGYEVLWRPTNAPFWIHFIPVGNVVKATVDVSKDDVVFGLRSIGKNGYKSPAVFAGFPSEPSN